MIKEILLTTLRNKETSRDEFRHAAQQLAEIVIFEVADLLPTKEVSIDTPLAPTQGIAYLHAPILIPILRSGFALLPSSVKYFPQSPIGFVGFKRDEQTTQPRYYYSNIPTIAPHDTVVILDPMLATGGTLNATIRLLKEQGVPEEHIIFVGIIAAKQGVERIHTTFPHVRLILAAIDNELNAQSYIIPGLGDFGDRYFGTE
jgi:uracil phosphoribosyltransferase